MKKRWQTGIYLLLYILLLAFITGFDIRQLFDIKSFLALVAGAFLLTLPFYEKGMKREEFLYIYGEKAVEAGLIQVFLLIFARLSENESYEELLTDIAFCFRPMLYAFCIRLIFGEQEDNVHPAGKEETEDREAQITEQKLIPSYEECIEAGLTRREAEIALFIIQKYSNKEIADSLFISEATVKKHVSNIFEKTKSSRREELIEYFKQS